jgi:hypothetical protein
MPQQRSVSIDAAAAANLAHLRDEYQANNIATSRAKAAMRARIGCGSGTPFLRVN